MLVIKLINDHVPPPPRHPYVVSFSRGRKIVWDQTCGSPEGSAWFTSPLRTSDYILCGFSSSSFFYVRTVRRWASVAFVPFGP